MQQYQQLSTNEKEKLKHQILTELYNSKIVKAKISGIVWRNHIHHSTLIHEDILQETFFHLSTKSADEIIDMYYDGGKKPEGHLNRLVGLSVRIAILKGVAKSSTNPDYAKHSVARHILEFSNLQKSDYISTGNENKEGIESTYALNIADPVSLEDDEDVDLWEFILSNLDDEDVEFVNWFLYQKKKTQGRYPKIIKDKYDRLVGNIKRIVNEKAINVRTPISHGFKKETFNNQKRKNEYIMTTELLLQKIETLLPIMAEFRAKGIAKISLNQYDTLREVYNEIFPGVRVDLACTTCVTHYLSMLESYYEREQPKFQQRIQQQEEPIVQVPEKKGRKKK